MLSIRLRGLGDRGVIDGPATGAVSNISSAALCWLGELAGEVEGKSQAHLTSQSTLSRTDFATSYSPFAIE
jgi:hypothetical protein